MTLWSYLQEIVNLARVVAYRKHARAVASNNYRPPSKPSRYYPFSTVLVLWGYKDYAYKSGEVFHLEIDAQGDFVQMIPFRHVASLKIFRKTVPTNSIAISLHGDYYFSPEQLETLDWLLSYLHLRCGLRLRRAIVGNRFAPYDLLPLPVLEVIEKHHLSIIPYGMYRRRLLYNRSQYATIGFHCFQNLSLRLRRLRNLDGEQGR